MKAHLEYPMALGSIMGRDVKFAAYDVNYLRGHEWAIDITEWHAMGRPVDITVKVEL